MYPIDHLYRGGRLNPDAIAIEDGSTTLSYRDLIAKVDALASGLQQRFPYRNDGVQARIGVCAFNTIEHLISVLAIYASENIWVALNPRNSPSELDTIINSTRLDAMIVDEDCLDHMTIQDVPIILGRTNSSAPDNLSIAKLIQDFQYDRPKRRYPDLSDTQTIKFTGGTTGQPKGALQSYRCVNTSIMSYLYTFRFSVDDVNLCAAPLTHGASHYILPIFSVGGKHLLIDAPKAPALLDAFEHRGCTTSFMPPTMIYNMLAEPGLENRDFSGIRHLHYGAAPMPPERIQQARAAFNNAIEVVYGQTEAPMMIAAMTAR